MTLTNNTPKKRWVLAPPIPNEVKQTLSDYPPFLRQLLFNRGITTAEAAQGLPQQRFADPNRPIPATRHARSSVCDRGCSTG